MAKPQRIQQIQDYLLNQADERLINLIYSMIKAEQERSAFDLPDNHRQILDQRLASHMKDPSAGKNWEEVKASLLSK